MKIKMRTSFLPHDGQPQFGVPVTVEHDNLQELGQAMEQLTGWNSFMVYGPDNELQQYNLMSNDMEHSINMRISEE